MIKVRQKVLYGLYSLIPKCEPEPPNLNYRFINLKFWNSFPEVILNTFLEFTRTIPVLESSFNKVANKVSDLQPAILLKEDSSTGVFQWILTTFWESLLTGHLWVTTSISFKALKNANGDINFINSNEILKTLALLSLPYEE